MGKIAVTFPDDERIEEAYRGKCITVQYAITAEEWGINTSMAVDGSELSVVAREYAMAAITQGRPLEEFVENKGKTYSKWPAEDWI